MPRATLDWTGTPCVYRRRADARLVVRVCCINRKTGRRCHRSRTMDDGATWDAALAAVSELRLVAQGRRDPAAVPTLADYA